MADDEPKLPFTPQSVEEWANLLEGTGIAPPTNIFALSPGYESISEMIYRRVELPQSQLEWYRRWAGADFPTLDAAERGALDRMAVES